MGGQPGLDRAVALFTIEETFGCQFTLSEQQEIETVQTLTDSCIDKLSTTQSEEMEKQFDSDFKVMLHNLHQYDLQELDALTEADAINILIPCAQRKKFWGNVSQTFNVELPRLEKPARLARFVTRLFYTLVGVFPILIGIIVFVVLVNQNAKLSFLLFAPLGSVLVSFFVFLAVVRSIDDATEGSRNIIPEGLSTIRDLKKYVLQTNVASNPPENWTPESISAQIRSIIAAEYQIDEKEIFPESNLWELER